MDTVFAAPMLPSPTPPTPTTSPTTDLTDAADPTKPGIKMRMRMRCARPALSRKTRRAWLTAGADSLHSVAQPTQNPRSHDHPNTNVPDISFTSPVSLSFVVLSDGADGHERASKRIKNEHVAPHRHVSDGEMFSAMDDFELIRKFTRARTPRHGKLPVPSPR